MLNVLTDDETADGAMQWFSQFGTTDVNYLKGHWDRFRGTRDFALSVLPPNSPQTILDIGAHWLHNAFLYANRGHRLICMDTPDLMESALIRETASALGAELRSTRRLEKADGLADLKDDSIDMVLFCEIIEHLSFNPIPFWKQVYRVLKPGGRIIITTPNAFYHRSVSERSRRVSEGECFGLSVSEIFETGTYGHHWKEYSLPELQAYFARLSPDFDTSRYEMICHSYDITAELPVIIKKSVAKKLHVRAFDIYLDVQLKDKKHGIEINPPWDPV